MHKYDQHKYIVHERSSLKDQKNCASVHTHQATASALAGRKAHRGTEKGRPEPICARGGVKALYH